MFYRQVYEAFFDSHDLSKGIDAHQKRSGLDIDDFSRMLKFVGYACMRKIGVKFDKVTILKVIGKAKGFCANLSFKESDFLKDMLTSVPLFCKDGNEYKWVHKSLMEYFAARFIADEVRGKRDEILTEIYKSEYINNYINLLDLYYDIDNLGFIKNIELPLLQEYMTFYENNIYESTRIEKKCIEERIGYLFAQTICIDIFDRSFYHHDLFEDIRERIRNNYGFLANSVTIISAGFVIGCLIQPQKE